MEWRDIILASAIAIVILNEIWQQKMGVAPMPTMPPVRRAMLEKLPTTTTGIIYELGSGWGKLGIEIAKKCKDAHIIGFEKSPVPLFFSKLKLFLRPWIKNATFKSADFLEMDLSNASAILCYLSNPHMAKLEPKFRRELKKGTVIISSTFYMPTWKPEETLSISVGGIYKVPVYIYRA